MLQCSATFIHTVSCHFLQRISRTDMIRTYGKMLPTGVCMLPAPISYKALPVICELDGTTANCAPFVDLSAACLKRLFNLLLLPVGCRCNNEDCICKIPEYRFNSISLSIGYDRERAWVGVTIYCIACLGNRIHYNGLSLSTPVRNPETRRLSINQLNRVNYSRSYGYRQTS